MENAAHQPEEPLVRSFSPEARRRAARNLRQRVNHSVGPGSRAFDVFKRTALGAWNDGFIHAGNLAYMAVLAIFPFFITGAALFSALGEEGEREALIETVLYALPPVVGNVIEPVARDVLDARSGWLLWAGALVGLWTVGSLIETIRDILRRAYGTRATLAFWRSRLMSSGIIVAAVIVLLLSLIAQVLIGAAQQVIDAYMPEFGDAIGSLEFTRLIPALGLFGSIYFLFYSLTPQRYRARRYPKWPGALATTLWWIGVSIAMPPVLHNFFAYDLTYGALSGIMIALFFFWLVGLGLVVGAELNAALAVSPEEEAAERAKAEVEKDGP
ncbi:YihY/virulence factor BrkB family protein [Parerythrobacter lacustris]|uniref:YihY/virulence factor BrkB family protein n=1 Tax=Parerythrobacter lacustris TaxID=2969984 RepID=A0ABT1XRZ8_9SPHN|nr:YihY/virulence factor BrkB family protein [Parerythrobacter lacustris]MCR2834387.1 YihY/virulence factor BrkB family protein [Parerythrobacter lacustris]